MSDTQTYAECPACQGTGIENLSGLTIDRCLTCKGAGRFTSSRPTTSNGGTMPDLSGPDVNNFWISGEHFSMEEADVILATTEQIGRLAWLESNARLSDAGRAAVSKALEASVELLDIQLAERRPKGGPGSKSTHLKAIG